MFKTSSLWGDSTQLVVTRPRKDSIGVGFVISVREPIMRFPPKKMAPCISDLVMQACTATPAHVCLTREKLIMNTGSNPVTIAIQKNEDSAPETFILPPGQTEIIPVGFWHALINSSSEPVTLQVVNSQPAEQGDVQWEDGQHSVQPELPATPGPEENPWIHP